MQKLNRLVSVVLVVAVVCGMICIAPFASASYVYAPEPSTWGSFRDGLLTVCSPFVTFLLPSNSWDFTFSQHGNVGSLSALDGICSDYNSFIKRAIRLGNGSNAFTTAYRAYDWDSGIYRLRDSKTGSWIVDSKGRFPYVESEPVGDLPSGEAVAPDYPGTPEISPNNSNRWLELAPIQTRLKSGALSGNTSYGYKHLADLLAVLRGAYPNVNYRFAPVIGGSYGICKNNLVLCDKDGKPYVAFKEDESSVANQTQNVYVKNDGGGDLIVGGDKVTTDIKILDKSENTLTIPVTNDNSTSVTIDNLLHQNIYDTSYNFDDHSYTVNTYDVTFNNDNRRYETNYYTWNITYNITNTYVTYIGSNDAYQQKEYEFYYELPDGRSSADLTADEVAAMSFQFADCMNYQRSATDTNLRALYHFDGDLGDAGFFSDKTSFDWVSGASITYMDSSTFNGALYLDETAHQFNITLPSNIQAWEDFTVQFRYYQASQPDTQNNINNSLALGGTTLARWDEQSLYPNTSPSAACALSVGNWVELALVRHNGTVYLYVNGLKVSSWANNAAFSKTLTFTFGTTSRAYSMLDELRVLNFALVTDGVSYTPTAVPYDSNLVLVLPGEGVVADSYWNVTSSGNLLQRSDFTTGEIDLVDVYNSSHKFYVTGCWGNYYSSSVYGGAVIHDGYITVAGGTDPILGCWRGFQYNLSYGGSSSSASSCSYAPGLSYATNYGKQHVFSVMDDSGQVYSFPFVFNSNPQSATFSWGKLSYCWTAPSNSDRATFLGIVPDPGVSINLIYAELVLGDSTNLHGEQVFNSYDLSSLKPNTAAVQTDIPLHGYTVGGVRPTFPVRGDVWFGVTNGRISTVQVYTGSAWTSSNARWWTGERWIPIYAFDIFTLEDCWDIADGDDVITPIESDTAGWNWWKKAWTDFRSWLGGVFGGGTPVEPSPSPSPTPTPSPSPSGPVIDDRPLMLASGVSIVRENADTWEAVNAASVKVTLETGDLWSSTNTVKNLFVVDLMNGATSDDLFVSLDVDGLPVKEYPQWDVVSFLLYGNDDNYASVRKASHFDGFSTAVEVFGGCQEHHGSSADNNVTSATFALHKKGNQVRVFVRPLGGEWQEGETLTVDFTVNKVGFCGWRFNDLGQTVTFSNLRISTASRYGLVKDADTMLTSFVANTSIVPFFLGGGFEVLPGRDPDGPDSAPRPSAEPMIDEDGSEVSIWDFPARFFDGLWSLLSGLVGVVAGGVSGLFTFIGDGMGGFFGAFSGDDGVFGFSTYGGADIWD